MKPLQLTGTVALVFAIGASAQETAEALCDLNGTAVLDCVRLMREAQAHGDAYMAEQLRRQARDALVKARAATETSPTQEAAPAITPKFALPVRSTAELRRPPIDQYRSHLEFSLIACKASYMIATTARAMPAAQPTSHGDFQGCLTACATRARELYDKTASSLRKAGARQALKDVHVAFLAALTGIAPAADEVRSAYSSRQATLDERLRMAWARFDIEQ